MHDDAISAEFRERARRRAADTTPMPPSGPSCQHPTERRIDELEAEVAQLERAVVVAVLLALVSAAATVLQ